VKAARCVCACARSSGGAPACSVSSGRTARTAAGRHECGPLRRVRRAAGRRRRGVAAAGGQPGACVRRQHRQAKKQPQLERTLLSRSARCGCCWCWWEGVCGARAAVRASVAAVWVASWPTGQCAAARAGAAASHGGACLQLPAGKLVMWRD
jgi:hypothetical protein